MNSFEEPIAREEALERYRTIVNEFHSADLDFELSSGAIIQSTRLGFFCHCDNNGMVIWTNKKETNNKVIVSSVGENRDELTRRVADSLFRETGVPVIVKNVSNDRARHLKEMGFREYQKDEAWDRYSRYDDNSFPQVILDVGQLAEVQGPTYRSLREELNRVGRKYSLEIAAFDAAHKDELSSLLRSWLKSMVERNALDKREAEEATSIFLQERDDLLGYEAYTHAGVLVGWLVFSEITPQCLGYNVLVNDFGLFGSYRRLMFEGARIARSLGYTYLNVQGSEDEAQYLSKKRLVPVLEIPKTHLVYDPGTQDRGPFRVSG